MTGKKQNTSGFLRKRAKQADRRRPHVDKYAGKRREEQPDDRR